jgi:hypothetical protein
VSGLCLLPWTIRSRQNGSKGTSSARWTNSASAASDHTPLLHLFSSLGSFHLFHVVFFDLPSRFNHINNKLNFLKSLVFRPRYKSCAHEYLH